MKIGHNLVSIVPGIIAIAMLVLALFAWPYAYYIFLKFVVTGMAAYYAYYLYQVNGLHGAWFWVFIFAAILFNPLMPIYLGDRGVWSIIDVGLVIVVGIFLAINRQK